MSENSLNNSARVSASASVNPEESLPWYRYPMVWMIILLPLIVVVAALWTVVIAYQNAPMLLQQGQSMHKYEQQIATPSVSHIESRNRQNIG